MFFFYFSFMNVHQFAMLINENRELYSEEEFEEFDFDEDEIEVVDVIEKNIILEKEEKEAADASNKELNKEIKEKTVEEKLKDSEEKLLL